MAIIIKEMWHGPSAQCLDIQDMSSTFRIFESSFDQDDARRRYSPTLEDRKAYWFQYYIWPDSCSLRYHTQVTLILVVAILYTLVIYFAISNNNFDHLQDDEYISSIFKVILVWVSSFFVGNLMDVVYQVVTKRKIRVDFNFWLDCLLLIGILLQIFNVPQIYQEYSIHKSQDDINFFATEFNVFLNSIMNLIVWLKISYYVLAIQSFGIYIRMFRHMLRVMLNFIILFLLWILCSSLIFTAMFYKESISFQTYQDSITNLYNGGLTNFNLGLFQNPRTEWWGSLFFIAYITITAIFLLNMIIAVLNNVYSQMIDKIDADHNAYIVYSYSGIRFDRKYGLLIFSQAPFNLISCALMPPLLLIYFCTDEKMVTRINKIFCKIAFFPLAIVLFLYYILIDLIYLPIAYFKSFILFALQGKNFTQSLIYLTLWLLFGPFILSYLILFDCVKFWYLVYQKPQIIKRRKKKNVTKMDLMKYQRAEDIKEQSNLDARQRYQIFIDRTDLKLLARTLKILNDKIMGEYSIPEEQIQSQNTQAQLNNSNLEKQSSLNQQSSLSNANLQQQNTIIQNDKIVFFPDLFKVWKRERDEMIRRETKKDQDKYKDDEIQDLHKEQAQRDIDSKMKRIEEEKKSKLQKAQSQTNNESKKQNDNNQNFKTKRLLTSAVNSISKQITTENHPAAKSLTKTVTALTQFSGNSGKVVGASDPMRSIGQNVQVLISMNKETMKELVVQLSTHEDFVEIDKLRKIIYDEQILTEMSEEEFQEYRMRLFNTNLTFFEKAIEKSKNQTTNNLAEIQYANEIASNFESMHFEFMSLKNKIKRIEVFMSCVKLDKLIINEDKLRLGKYHYLKQGATKVIERWQKRKEERAKEKLLQEKMESMRERVDEYGAEIPEGEFEENQIQQRELLFRGSGSRSGSRSKLYEAQEVRSSLISEGPYQQRPSVIV